MKKSEGTSPAHRVHILLLCISLAACAAPTNRHACVFSEPPAEELLLDKLQHLQIIDAETGEVATYDSLGNPVLEGGQPLALWAEFEQPTRVELCVKEVDGRTRPHHFSEVTFTDEIITQPLGRYDFGTYMLHISMNGSLVSTIEFNVR